MADQPLAYWRLGESTGDIAYDETGNQLDATYVNAPALGAFGALAGDHNTAVGFHLNQYVRWTPESPYAGDFTVEAWVRVGSPRAINTFFSTRTRSAEYSFDFKFDALDGHEIRSDVGNGVTWLSNTPIPFAFQRRTWYHVVAVVTTTGATYYVNGAPIGSVVYSGTPLLFDEAHHVQIGTNTRYDDEWFLGVIDEVAIYDYALSGARVSAHYTAGLGY